MPPMNLQKLGDVLFMIMKKTYLICFIFLGLMLSGCQNEQTATNTSNSSSVVSYADSEISPEAFTDINSPCVMRITVNGKEGLVDSNTKQIVVEPIYEHIDAFSDDLALAKIGETYRYLNEKGEVVLSLPEDGGTAGPFIDGLAMRSFSSTNPVLDFQDQPFERHPCVYPLSDTVYGYIDKTGAFVIPPIYSGNGGGEWSDRGTLLVRDYASGLWGVINKQGEYLVAPTYVSLERYSGSDLNLVVTTDEKYGYINQYGEIILEPVYERLGLFSPTSQLAYALGVSGK